jgi:molybdopterin-binding protein
MLSGSRLAQAGDERVHVSTQFVRAGLTKKVIIPKLNVKNRYVIRQLKPNGRCTMKISARNTLKGKVKTVKTGAVNDEIIVELPGGAEIVSIITKASAESLGLVPGREVYAIIKASNVMIGVD